MTAKITMIGPHAEDGWHWSVMVAGDLVEGDADTYEQAVRDAADAE